jgi:2,4-dienoyl-CoA reductase-like NADH-dependent reductase (Old Yellow Enzyme family)/thioredoxin reductase
VPGVSVVNDFKYIFEPLRIGSMTVKNRIELAPVGPLMASNGLVSRELIEWGREFARGGAGIVTLGMSGIVILPGVTPGNALNLGTDNATNPLNRFAETVQRYGARSSIQLNYITSSMPADMTLAEIKMVIDGFAAAAYRCLSAGMDMIMIHGAHGHLTSRFFSPRKNLRADSYGGSLKNRVRLAVEILDAIRNKVGNKLAIEYRISAEEFIKDGLNIEEQLEFATLIQDKIDLIHVSAGMLDVPETLPMMIQPAYLPRGINVAFAARFKKELKIPVAAVGSLDLEMAEEIIKEKKADIVAMGRTLIADPDCIEKARMGNKAEIRPCIRCNTCIDRTHNQRLTVHCAVNPYIGREVELKDPPMPAVGKKVVIIGGGPSGMESARTAARRGHRVVLFEKTPTLGGNLNVAAAAPFKTDMKKYLDWAIQSTLKTPGVKINLSADVTPETVKAERPDVLIIAAGSSPVIPQVPGIESKKVVLAGDVDLHKVTTGQKVIIVGAGLTGSETALLLAQEGREVTLIDKLSLNEIDAGVPFINITALRKMLKDLQVKTIEEVDLDSITKSGAVVKDKDGHRLEIVCDTVVLSLGVEPRKEVISTFKDLAPHVYTTGDCRNRRGNLCSAVSDGFFAALEI